MNPRMLVPLCLCVLGCNGRVYLHADPDAAIVEPPAVMPDAMPGMNAPPVDAGAADAGGAALDAGPCAPVGYDFTDTGSSGPSYALFLAEITASNLLAWSAFGFGATPGSVSLDAGETITITWSGQGATDIEIAWSDAGTVRLDIERWDGTQAPARTPADGNISFVGPLRSVTLTALAGATDLYLTSLAYCAR
jgi:hypothetical protein